MTNLSQILRNKGNRRPIIIAVVLLFAMLPFFVFSSHNKELFVDQDAKGKEDGSHSHPYRTIKEAMKHAERGTEIHVAGGKYEENVDMKEGVKLFGKSEKATIIEAKNDGKATVIMRDRTKIGKVTIQEGEDGIRVEDNARVDIWEATIRENDDDGIHIESGNTKESERVVISDCNIEHNRNAGIYGGERRIIITNSDIRINRTNGIDLEKGADAWIAGNNIIDNKGRGMKLRVDDSNIWTKNNTVKHNIRGGIEVHFDGERGRIDITKSEISMNGDGGILRVQRLQFANSGTLWNNYLTFGNRNNIFQNGGPNVSNIIYAD